MIGIFAALRRELKPIAACLAELDEFAESGVRFSVGRMNRASIVLVQTGIGWNRASAAAKIAAARFPFKVYISTGFAGALQETIRVGDIVIGQKILSLERPDAKTIVCDTTMTRLAETAAKNIFISRNGPYISQRSHHISRRDPAGSVFAGSIVTVQQIVGRSEEKKSIAMQSEAVALDMETAAIAEAAEQRGVPFVAVRAVSDTLNEDFEFDGDRLLTDGGSFRWGAGIGYLATHPAALSHLNRLRRQSNVAARSLGLFFQEFLPSFSLN